MLTIHVEENRRHSGWNQGISGQMGSELSTEASYERRSRGKGEGEEKHNLSLFGSTQVVSTRIKI